MKIKQFVASCIVAGSATFSLYACAHAQTISRVAGIRSVPSREIFNAIHNGSSIVFAAYSLQENQRVFRELAEAGASGRSVHVYLNGAGGDSSESSRGSRRYHSYGRRSEGNWQSPASYTGRSQGGWESPASGNAAVADALRAQHVTVTLTPWKTHIKAAIIDGSAFFADRNWTSGDDEALFLDSRPQDRALIERAIEDGRGGSNALITTVKGTALDREAAVIRAGSSSQNLDIESESFGDHGVVQNAILYRLAHGTKVRILVASREYNGSTYEREMLNQLQSAGADIRLTNSDEKIAVSGDLFYTGSANATQGVLDQIEIGFVGTDQNIASSLEQNFENEWSFKAWSTEQPHRF